MISRMALFFSITFLFLGGCKNSNSFPVIDLDAANFKKQITGKEVVLLDVRTSEEIAAGSIEGAQQLDINSAQFEEKALLIPKDKPLFIYCRSGGRSKRAALFFVEKGYKEVYNLDGGVIAWGKENYKLIIEKE